MSYDANLGTNIVIVLTLALFGWMFFRYLRAGKDKAPVVHPADHFRLLAEKEINELAAEIHEARSLTSVFRLRDKIKAFDEKYTGKVDSKTLLYMILGLYEELMKRCEFEELDFFS